MLEAAAAALRWLWVAAGMKAVSNLTAGSIGCGAGSSGGAPSSEEGLCVARPAGVASAAATIAFAIRAIFWGALVCHALQAAYAGRLAARWKLAAGAAAARSFALGFANTRLIVAAGGGRTDLVPIICVSLFVACAAGAVVAHAAAAGLGVTLL
jgi:hypothetical protein